MKRYLIPALLSCLTLSSPLSAQQNVVDPRSAPATYSIESCGGGTNVPDNSPALLRCSVPGHEVTFGSGTYHFGSAVEIKNTNGVYLHGRGPLGTTFSFDTTSGDDITLTNSQYVKIDGIWFSPSVRKTDGYVIKFNAGSFHDEVSNLRFDYGYNGIWAFAGAELRTSDISYRYMRGTRGTLLGGAVGATVYRAVLDDTSADNPYPLAPGSRVTWSSNMTINAGQIVVAGSGVWQAVVAGTTGPSFPSWSIPGTGPSDWTTTNLTDGSVQWRYVANNDLRWLVQDSFAYSIVVTKAALLDGEYCVSQLDTVKSGHSYPMWLFGWDVECDHNYVAGAQLAGGEGFYLNGSWIGSALTGNGVEIDGTHRGEVAIQGGTRIMGNWQHGVLLQAGPKDVSIVGDFIGANSQGGKGIYHGVTVAGGASDFTISDNKIGVLVSGGNPQGYGVYIERGFTDRYVITNNRLNGNVSGGLMDKGIGLSKTKTGNF